MVTLRNFRILEFSVLRAGVLKGVPNREECTPESVLWRSWQGRRHIHAVLPTRVYQASPWGAPLARAQSRVWHPCVLRSKKLCPRGAPLVHPWRHSSCHTGHTVPPRKITRSKLIFGINQQLKKGVFGKGSFRNLCAELCFVFFCVLR